MLGLGLYTIFGCIAGLFDNILLILVCRALVGVGVGIMMPLSTGLIAFYFTRDKQAPLMGYSSALNMMGGVIATLIAGGFSMISWRLSFLVYALGLISILLCLIWMPNERIYDRKQGAKSHSSKSNYIPYILVMFLLSFSFFIYPANFALECTRTGVIPQGTIAPIMAMMDVFGFFGGLCFSSLNRKIRSGSKFLAPLLFIAAYLLLGITGGVFGILAGSALVGLANGIGVPFLMTSASAKAGKDAATTVMPLLSAALYLAQFTTPLLLSAAARITDANAFLIALCGSIVLLAASLTIRR